MSGRAREYEKILFLCMPHIYLERTSLLVCMARATCACCLEYSTRKQYSARPLSLYPISCHVLVVFLHFWFIPHTKHSVHVFQTRFCSLAKSFSHLSLITIERPHFIYMINVVFVRRALYQVFIATTHRSGFVRPSSDPHRQSFLQNC